MAALQSVRRVGASDAVAVRIAHRPEPQASTRATESAAGLPKSLSSAVKSERRRQRKASKARGTLLQAAKKELIKRALWEDHPDTCGDSLCVLPMA
eukprot:309021-Prymnesium_polylepis.1